ncbi:MAG: neutral/alkaline non-lysosomal ceramidase N-terminal domain-containing protein [Tepidiformaceae bacterium]
MNTVMAGASVLDITSPVGVEMGGYGARKGVSMEIHDNLNVRTLVLDDGATKLVIAICDFVGVGPMIVQRAREIIADDLGIPAQNVCIAATHTHSGPLTVRTGDGADYSHVTAAKIAGSVRVALSSMQPVSLKVGLTEVSTISQNRRDPGGAIETVVKVLLAAAPGGGEPIATVVNYACHATVLEHDNLHYSADFPGVAARLVEHALGGKCIYMQGACGDINPAWMRHDFAEIRRVGGILGAAAARTAHELRPLGEEQWCINLSWSEDVPVQPSPGTVLSEIALSSGQTFLDLQRKVLPEASEIETEFAAVESQMARLSADDVEGRRALRPRLNQLRMDRVAKQRFPVGNEPTQRVEVQAFRLSTEAAVIMLPGEFFVQTAKEIEARAGVQHLFVCAYANDYAGYFAPANEFPCAGYEVGSTRFVPEAEGMVVDAAVALLGSLYGRQQ